MVDRSDCFGNIDHVCCLFIHWLYFRGSLVPGLYRCFLIFYIKAPAAKINHEKNRLVVMGGFPVNINQITDLEEKEKKGLNVRYFFDGMERFILIPSLRDEDKPRLLADLLRINPNIVIIGSMNCCCDPATS